MKFNFLIYLLAFTLSTNAQKAKANKAKSKANTTIAQNSKDGIFAEINTSKGLIVLQLEYKKAPITVANFISLAQGTNPEVKVESKKGKPFYDGLKFHRVIKDFMIQGGCPLGTGSGDPGYKFIDEFTDLKHSEPGILSMANSGPSTNGSQFFITHKETSWLDGKHTVFGKVTKGQDVVDKIVQDDQIISVKINQVGAEAKKFDAVKVFANGFTSQKDILAKQEAQKKLQQELMMAEKAKKDKAYFEANKEIIDANKSQIDDLKATGNQLPSGVIMKTLKPGNGIVPEKDKEVFINYAGYLENGVLFDSSYEDVSRANGKFDENRKAGGGYAPFPFPFGKKNGLIPGFIEALEKMTFNEKIIVYIPSNLAWGTSGSGEIIPPSSNVTFIIEMLEKKE
jgi:peptidyl-prolyl cis-trans isomerase A (cyclophilin A)